MVSPPQFSVMLKYHKGASHQMTISQVLSIRVPAVRNNRPKRNRGYLQRCMMLCSSCPPRQTLMRIEDLMLRSAATHPPPGYKPLSRVIDHLSLPQCQMNVRVPADSLCESVNVMTSHATSDSCWLHSCPRYTRIESWKMRSNTANQKKEAKAAERPHGAPKEVLSLWRGMRHLSLFQIKALRSTMHRSFASTTSSRFHLHEDMPIFKKFKYDSCFSENAPRMCLGAPQASLRLA